MGYKEVFSEKGIELPCWELDGDIMVAVIFFVVVELFDGSVHGIENDIDIVVIVFDFGIMVTSFWLYSFSLAIFDSKVMEKEKVYE
jgi:hypothetical protein